MLKFRDMPVKQKLTITVLVTTSAGLLLSGVGMLVADSFLFRSDLRRDLTALSEIVAGNSTAALAFNDPRTASETLSSLRARTHLVAACIYRLDGTVLASYVRSGDNQACPAAASRREIRSAGPNLVVSLPIVLQGRPNGALVILYDRGEIGERIRLYGLTVFGVLLASNLLAFLLSSRLLAIVAAPILQLAEAATSISKTRDYGIRARKVSRDELGGLVDAFNEMLASIQSRDVDLRKALSGREEALSEAQNARKFLETTLASIGDAVITTDIGGRMIFANPVAQSLLEYGEAGLAGKHLDEVFRIVNERSRAGVESTVSKILRGGAASGGGNHTILITRTGKEIPIDDSAAPIRDARGTIQGAVLVFRDVTARRRAEEVTRLLASIVESSDDAIIGLDLNGRFTSWNKGAERIFGYTAAETIGCSTSIIAGAGRADDIPGILERIRMGERIDQFQAARRTKSGKVIEVSITISPLYDDLGRIVGASKIARDVTGQVRAAEHLAQLNASLQKTNGRLARSNDDLERFAFVASHDLQEPLRMITVYSQLLLKAFPGEPSVEVGMYMEYIVGGTRRMRELLADLLAYSEIGARQDEPSSVVDLNAVLEKATQNLKASIDANGAVIAAARLPVVSVEEAHFISLFQNLLGNAIKYRGAQPPRIDVSFEETDGQLRFAVADNGIGIEPAYREKIFVPFKRLHGKNIPGTGIGLAICQRVIERYGGRIWVESEPGNGSTFIFTLPNITIARRES
jgi:PAS domain S-box-containing protein